MLPCTRGCQPIPELPRGCGSPISPAPPILVTSSWVSVYSFGRNMADPVDFKLPPESPKSPPRMVSASMRLPMELCSCCVCSPEICELAIPGPRPTPRSTSRVAAALTRSPPPRLTCLDGDHFERLDSDIVPGLHLFEPDFPANFEGLTLAGGLLQGQEPIAAVDGKDLSAGYKRRGCPTVRGKPAIFGYGDCELLTDDRVNPLPGGDVIEAGDPPADSILAGRHISCSLKNDRARTRIHRLHGRWPRDRVDDNPLLNQARGTFRLHGGAWRTPAPRQQHQHHDYGQHRRRRAIEDHAPQILSNRQTARRATVTGIRAALTAGSTPPNRPIASAQETPMATIGPV